LLTIGRKFLTVQYLHARGPLLVGSDEEVKKLGGKLKKSPPTQPKKGRVNRYECLKKLLQGMTTKTHGLVFAQTKNKRSDTAWGGGGGMMRKKKCMNPGAPVTRQIR